MDNCLNVCGKHFDFPFVLSLLTDAFSVQGEFE